MARTPLALEQCSICFVHSSRFVDRTDCVLSQMVWGSDAGFVTVEGRDMKHVAVCANPDRLHLSVPGQRSRVGGAARAKNLATASTVMLSPDDSEGSLAGDADATGFIRHPVGRLFELALAGLGCHFR